MLLDDYRAMVAHMVLDPVFNAVDGSSEAYWRLKLDSLLAAWEDLGCEALAERT